MATVIEFAKELMAQIIEQLIKFCRDYGDEDIVIIKDDDEYIIGT